MEKKITSPGKLSDISAGEAITVIARELIMRDSSSAIFDIEVGGHQIKMECSILSFDGIKLINEVQDE